MKLKSILCIMMSMQLLLSCGLTSEEKRLEAIEQAKDFLTKSKCQNAITVLENVGRDNKNAKYLQTLSSAYACKAGYSTPAFWGENLVKVNGTQSGLFGSLTTFSTSLMRNSDDNNYVNLQSAIDILLYAGEVSNPSSDERALVFTSDEASDINIQILFMLLTQIGKYLFYYGNADPITGKKGTGSSSNGNPNNLSNGCIYDYDPTDPVILNSINTIRTAGSIGSCTAVATGHFKLLALPNAHTVTRMCQAVILFNQLIDIAANTTMPNDGGNLSTISSNFSALCSAVSGLGNLCSVLRQSECEEDFGTSPETDKLQLFIFSIFESLFL